MARLPGKDTELFGINRQTEHAISRVAWEIGIAPEPVAFLAEHEILVTRFVEGGPIETTDPVTIRSVARLLHRLHSAPEVPGTFDLPSVIEDLHLDRQAVQRHPPRPTRRGAGILPGKLSMRSGVAREFRLRATTT